MSVPVRGIWFTEWVFRAELKLVKPMVVPERGQAPRFLPEECAGRLVEISGNAAMTMCVGLIRKSQEVGEPTAWVTRPDACFFPPDVAQSGVDLNALAVVRIGDFRRMPRAAERLLRSGAFGLVILDLGKDGDLSLPMQGRLLSLAQKHDAALVCLTDRQCEEPSLGSMISLRAHATRAPIAGGRYRCKVAVLKDKRRGPNWSDEETTVAPPSLR
jgi:recombination protein RecA